VLDLRHRDSVTGERDRLIGGVSGALPEPARHPGENQSGEGEPELRRYRRSWNIRLAPTVTETASLRSGFSNYLRLPVAALGVSNSREYPSSRSLDYSRSSVARSTARRPRALQVAQQRYPRRVPHEPGGEVSDLAQRGTDHLRQRTRIPAPDAERAKKGVDAEPFAPRLGPAAYRRRGSRADAGAGALDGSEAYRGRLAPVGPGGGIGRAAGGLWRWSVSWLRSAEVWEALGAAGHRSTRS
jgi:hypothetical protein